ncbi:MAG: hypothetical protein EZS28_013130 [Streblomastix strix]|uniref:Uncharacterized protein n=1 Tax=Streblomastix strix TaxID=222440 RepID=A0A5J4W8S5_9EUKA|nr:MAG: hypothetical protein EZS28_013130 [Streblomastix strix]
MQKQQKSNWLNVPKLTYEDEVLSFRQTGKIPKQPRVRKYATDEEAKQVAIQQRKICHARYQLQKAQFKQQAEDSQVFAIKRLKKFVITDKKHLEQIHNIIDLYDETMIEIKKTIEQGEIQGNVDDSNGCQSIQSDEINTETALSHRENSNDQISEQSLANYQFANSDNSNDNRLSPDNVSDSLKIEDLKKKQPIANYNDIAISEDDCTELLRELRNRYES